VVDEENGIFAALYLDCLFEEGGPGHGGDRRLVPAYLQGAFGLEEAGRMGGHRTVRPGLWRFPGLSLVLEFTLPGLQPRVTGDG